MNGVRAAAPQNLNTLKFSEVFEKVLIIDAATQRSRPATVNDVLKAPDQVSTGGNSRAELVAPDGTVTRVGANTVFGFAADKREVNLQKGSVLFHSPTGKGGGTVSTEQAQAAVMGTTLIVTATESGGFKLLVLEGKAKATLPTGNTVAVTAGQLTVVTPGRRDFSPVLNFRLKDQVAGSSLMKGFSAPVASEAKVMDSVTRQERMIMEGRAEPTNMRVRGERLMADRGPQDGPPPGNFGAEVQMERRQREDLRTSAEFKGILDGTNDQVLSALNANVAIKQFGGSPASNLFFAGKAYRLQPAFESIFGATELAAAKLAHADKTVQFLAGNSIAIGGVGAVSFPDDGNLSQYLFPDSVWMIKGIAAQGALSIDDAKSEDDIRQRFADQIQGASSLFSTEDLFWIASKGALTVSNTFLKARADILRLGTSDPTIPGTVDLSKSIIYNRSGAIQVDGSSVTSSDTTIAAMGDISINSRGDITVANNWARDFTARSGGNLSMVAGATGNINITGPSTPGLSTMLGGVNIALDARTINLTNVDFQDGSTVVLRSGLGALASNPNTGAASVPRHVNFIRGVSYGGTAIPTTATTSTLPAGMTIQANGR